MMLAGGFIVIYSLASSVFGDGYFDLQKHCVLLSQGLLWQLAGIGLRVWEATSTANPRPFAGTVPGMRNV